MRFRTPEIFLGAFLSVAIFAMGMLFASSQKPSGTTQQVAAAKAADQGEQTKAPDSDLTGSTWLTNDAAGFFTFVLVGVGGIQAWFFWVQLRLIRESLTDAKTAADAAKESADAAKMSADHIPRVERAYLFLGLDYKAEFKDFAPGYADNSTRSTMEFGFKNHGRTPALVEGLYATAGYWRGPDWPAMSLAEGVTIQQGFAISGGETVEGYTVEFPLTKKDRDKAEAANGIILFWGKIIYRDVFGDLHETAWCRGYQLAGMGWHFAGDEDLNHYT
jgi:hypothetical protein